MAEQKTVCEHKQRTEKQINGFALEMSSARGACLTNQSRITTANAASRDALQLPEAA